MAQGDLERQYGRPDPLLVRMKIHRDHQEREIDLHVESARCLGLQGAETLLDAGCGTGHFLVHLRTQGHRGRLVGFDQSAGMVALLPDSVEGVVGDVQDLPYADNEFDWAVARHMLYHVADIPGALAELHRVARLGVLITTNSRINMEYFNRRIHDVLRGIGEHPTPPVVNRFCLENAGDQIAACGYRFDREVLDNQLVFRSARPIVEHILSCLPGYGITPEHPRYPEIEAWLDDQIEVDLAMADFTMQIRTKVGIFLIRK